MLNFQAEIFFFGPLEWWWPIETLLSVDVAHGMKRLPTPGLHKQYLGPTTSLLHHMVLNLDEILGYFPKFIKATLHTSKSFAAHYCAAAHSLRTTDLHLPHQY